MSGVAGHRRGCRGRPDHPVIVGDGGLAVTTSRCGSRISSRLSSRIGPDAWSEGVSVRRQRRWSRLGERAASEAFEQRLAHESS